MTDRRQIAIDLGVDRVLAHQVLFQHRHPDRTPKFHVEIIRDWHGEDRQVATQAFRGGGKSTIAEEALIIRALYREFKNGLIVGATQDLAAERLRAIKHELETNERIIDVFGEMVGPTWTEDEIILTNNVRILAKSRGQKMRGTKFQDQRPDAVFVDDIEDTEDSLETIKATKKWLMTVLIPALDPRAIIRIAATPVHPEALAEDLHKDSSWTSRKYPIRYRDEAGAWTATWPDRFPLADIERIEASFQGKGMLREFNMEYMCAASRDEDRAFRDHMIRVEPRVRTWQAVYGMFDPARTVRESSATTGFAAWSWMPNLVVWDAWGRRLFPDAIVASIFEFNEKYSPVWVGVEEDGLNEWLLQPIRQEQVRRGVALPLRAVRAPKGKHAFIRGLQPFFNAREVTLATELPDLRAQLLSFPNGVIDVPNALAYALRMRPGAPVYDGFGPQHVAENLMPAHGQPLWLALNATGHTVTGVLAQLLDGSLRVLGDYVREGDAGEWVEHIVAAAQADGGRGVRIVVPPEHFSAYNTSGLTQAVKRLPADPRKGVDVGAGKGWIRDILQRQARGQQRVLISGEARNTLNAFAGGYARSILKGGHLADYADEGVYRVLMEGLESFCGLMKIGVEAEDDGRHYDYTRDGRRFVSALARR